LSRQENRREILSCRFSQPRPRQYQVIRCITILLSQLNKLHEKNRQSSARSANRQKYMPDSIFKMVSLLPQATFRQTSQVSLRFKRKGHILSFSSPPPQPNNEHLKSFHGASVWILNQNGSPGRSPGDAT